jgi:hypothetical protein
MTRIPPTPAAQQAVDTILGLAGLSVDDEEYERLLRTYPMLRDQVAALRIPEVRHAEPAIIFSPLDRT